MAEQRVDPETRDRIIRLESIVERIETDVKDVISAYKTLADKHTEMFVEAVKTGAALQASIDKLSTGVVTLNGIWDQVETRLDDMEKAKNQFIGIIIGVTVVVNLIGWGIALFVGHFL